jgi:hypothetical protein
MKANKVPDTKQIMEALTTACHPKNDVKVNDVAITWSTK